MHTPARGPHREPAPHPAANADADPLGHADAPRSLAGRNFQRILIVKPSSLGDIIHALPVLHGLRRRFPDAAIDWLVATAFAPLIDAHPDLDHVVLFDRERFSRLGRSLAPTLEFIDFLRDFRARAYDLAIDLQGLFRSGFLALATGAPVRLGFAAARECAWLFYTHRIRDPAPRPSGTESRTPPPDLHAVDRNGLVGRLLGFDSTPMRFDLAVTDAERAAAARILTAAGMDPDRPFIALWPGARWETKRWPPEKFAAVVDRLAASVQHPAALMGDPTERSLCEAVARRAAAGPAVLAGRSSIRQAVALLERAALVVTHDSAPMHIAAALDRPLVAILGPTNPRRTGPYGRPDAVVQSDIPCAPCYLKRLADCPHEHRCMADLDVADVVRKAEETLAAADRAGGILSTDHIAVRSPAVGAAGHLPPDAAGPKRGGDSQPCDR